MAVLLCNEVKVKVKSKKVVLFTCNEVKNLPSTFTCNEVGFRDVTCTFTSLLSCGLLSRYKLLKASLFKAPANSYDGRWPS